MNFKSTIFIVGVALIFILPLVISSPISGAKRGGGRKTTTTTTTTTEKPKRIITDLLRLQVVSLDNLIKIKNRV